jgi:putative ABC transport system substrate-binding protein
MQFNRLKRREFITLVGGAAAAWPLAARAQQAPRAPTIGFLGATTAAAQDKSVAAFLQRLRALGWLEGHNLTIEYRWAEARNERAEEIASEFGRLKVDVIVTSGAGPVLAAKRATTSIPIIFTIATDPIGTGLVASLARPGGNITGMSYQGGDLSGKRLEIAREIVPDLRRLGVLANVVSPGAALEMRQVQATAALIDLEVAALEVRGVEDVANVFETFKGFVNALYVCADPLVNNNRGRIAALALAARLPAIYGEREHVEAGGLVSYGPNLTDLYRRAADLVDKVLRGTKPSEIPVEQPTKFDLVINLKTAKTLGIDVPPTLLARADEVIE